MKKYILTAILISNSALLMSQNFVQTNVSNEYIQTNSANWLNNRSHPSNKPKNTNIAQQTRSNLNGNALNNNGNDRLISNKSNPVQTNIRNNSAVQTANVRQTRNVNNPAPVQRVYNINDEEQNIKLQNDNSSASNESNQQLFTNGNLFINIEPVQAKQIQFLADNNKSNIQLARPSFDFSFEQEQQVKVKIKNEKVKKDKISLGSETETAKIKDGISLNSKVKEEAKSNIKKHKGGSFYSQKNKSYLGKKMKIWCKKNLKFVKKIRAKVTCPSF